MNIVLFGAPGSGKGTQSSFLVEKMGMVQISTGDLLRNAIKNSTDLGRKAQVYVDKVELVSDSIVIGMVDEKLAGLGGKAFIFDGFPRNVAQAEALNKILLQRKMEIGRAIFLEMPTGELLGRLTGRRVCKSCNAVYHVRSKPPQKQGVCDLCGSEVVQRNDDKEEVIITRLKAYEDSTLPLRKFYKTLDKYVEVNGNQAAEVVFLAVKNHLN